MAGTQESDKNIDFKVSVILPAGGTGERFGCDQPKQYCKLLNKPLIHHTISAFYRLPWIHDIVVVVSPEYKSYINEIILGHFVRKVKVTEGSSTRHRSIHAGIKCLQKGKSEPKVVIIHDAVRPFVDEDIIKKVAVNATIYGASIFHLSNNYNNKISSIHSYRNKLVAGVTRPLVSTVISADDENLLLESLDRSKYVNSEMPQAFEWDILTTAYNNADVDDYDFGTECLLLAMKYTKTRAKLIPGPDNLWKVTYKKDLFAAESLLKEKLISVSVQFFPPSPDEVMVENFQSACNKKSLHFQVNNSHKYPCNSIINVYTDTTDITRNKLDIITADTCKKYPTFNIQDPDITPCVLHVFNGETLELDKVSDFMKSISEVQRDHKHILIVGILYLDDDLSRLSEMIVSLIWNRDQTLSGQSFIINRS
ncbi:hypothetical protein ACF0H5_012479 [Mactra antiquata]